MLMMDSLKYEAKDLTCIVYFVNCYLCLQSIQFEMKGGGKYWSIHFKENQNDWALAKKYRIIRWDGEFNLGVDDNHALVSVTGGSDLPDNDNFKSYTVR